MLENTPKPENSMVGYKMGFFPGKPPGDPKTSMGEPVCEQPSVNKVSRDERVAGGWS